MTLDERQIEAIAERAAYKALEKHSKKYIHFRPVSKDGLELEQDGPIIIPVVPENIAWLHAKSKGAKVVAAGLVTFFTYMMVKAAFDSWGLIKGLLR